MKLPEDPFVRELLPEFVDSWLDDIESQFQLLIDEKKSDDLYRFGHTLKGSCYQFGLDEIALKGIELMKFAKESQWDDAIAIKNDIVRAFLEAKNFLKGVEI